MYHGGMKTPKRAARHMKIIFLDIDGVLNWAGTPDRIGRWTGLCDKRIARFNRIIDAHPDAKIVISSSWRDATMDGAFDGFDELVDFLHKRGLRGDIIGKTVVRFSHVPRGVEIREWVERWTREHPQDTLTFVILDDDAEGMEGWGKKEMDLRPFHVLTEWAGWSTFKDGKEVLDQEGGLQDRHIEEAIKLLTRVA